MHRETQNPFKLLLGEFADRFVQRFNNPEEAPVALVKKYILVALRKLYRVLLSYFHLFRERGFRELLYSTLQTLYYAKIYWMLFAMITWKARVLTPSLALSAVVQAGRHALL